MDHLDAIVEAGAEMLDQGMVDFDGDDAVGALEEFFGEGAAAGADLNDQLDMVRTCGRGDSFKDRSFD